MNIYRHQLFESKPLGHGGEKRSAQIDEILEDAGLKYTILPLNSDNSRGNINCIESFLNALWLYIKVLLIIKRFPSPVLLYQRCRWAACRLSLMQRMKFSKTGILLLEISKIEHAFLIPYFRKRRFKIIALPHNLEALVPGQKSALTGKKSPFWLYEELRMLNQCNAVFAISKEDTLLLRQFGLNAFYLPYYPPKPALVQLISVRKKRESNLKKDKNQKTILMLGSAINPPTREGMIDRIKFFRKNKIIGYKLIIAGFHTQILSSYVDNKNENIQLLGELTNQQLLDLMSEIDCVLIHQPPTSGALTRITELLIADVPVVANFVSARDYYGMDGICTYHNDIELIKILQRSFRKNTEFFTKKTFNEILLQTIVLLSDNCHHKS